MTNPKYLIPLLCVLFAGCTNTSNKENLAYQFIKPIPTDKSLFNGDLKELNATTLPALFSFTDFNWKDSTLTLTAYSIDTYKASEIDNLQKGDTILFRNDTIITDKIERGKYISINGGIEFGGVDLTAHEEGTYRVLLMDNHPQYSELGKVKLPLSPALTIIDCGDNPGPFRHHPHQPPSMACQRKGIQARFLRTQHQSEYRERHHHNHHKILDSVRRTLKYALKSNVTFHISFLGNINAKSQRKFFF
jgi:hypothetical protein